MKEKKPKFRLNAKEKIGVETMIRVCEAMLAGETEINITGAERERMSEIFYFDGGYNKSERKAKNLEVKRNKHFEIVYHFMMGGGAFSAKACCIPCAFLKVKAKG